MNANLIGGRFAAMGARIKVRESDSFPKDGPGYEVDIRHDRRGEFFEVRVAERSARALDFRVAQIEKRDRHLLLFVEDHKEAKIDRFLCGHDERAWFVAAVPGGASSVLQAKEALKPALVRARQRLLRTPFRYRNRRRNSAFLRQGEWFFVPMSWQERDPIDERFVFRNEPIRRGSGKPHIVQELYRVAGELVYVNAAGDRGLTSAQFERLNSSQRIGWRFMRRNARVYARGTIRHQDHATIRLIGWHRVLMNTETETDTMRNVAFID